LLQVLVIHACVLLLLLPPQHQDHSSPCPGCIDMPGLEAADEAAAATDAVVEADAEDTSKVSVRLCEDAIATWPAVIDCAAAVVEAWRSSSWLSS
jgi:pyruvate/2-oxoacid:ferredoxin oxidoreductase beta subunit